MTRRFCAISLSRGWLLAAISLVVYRKSGYIGNQQLAAKASHKAQALLDHCIRTYHGAHMMPPVFALMRIIHHAVMKTRVRVRVRV